MFNPDEKIENAWLRSKGLCECEQTTDGHQQRCLAVLQWERRGKGYQGGWEAYCSRHSNAGGWEGVNQCKILCWACYEWMTRGQVSAA